VRVVLAALWLCACNQVYGIEETVAVDDKLDSDGDTVPNVLDNCPDDANKPQYDEDGDGFGDVCDNCPLIVNAHQTDVDQDNVGDTCDPHPVATGDCTVLFDSFNEPGTVATHWDVEDTAVNGDAMIDDSVAGSVMLIPPPVDAHSALLTARGLTGSFDVMISGDTLTNSPVISGARIEAVTNASGFASYYGCGVQIPSGVTVPSGGPTTYAPTSSMNPLGTKLVARLVTRDVSGSLHLRCRVDYGIALGALDVGAPTVISAARTGVLALWTPVRIDAIHITTFDPSGAQCAAVFR